MPIFTEAKRDSKKISKIISLLALVLFTPILIWAVYQVTNYFSNASVVKANIVVDASQTEGILNGNWLNFAQGGEQPPPMLSFAILPMQLLHPKYIRIDHIYDYYNIVKEDGSLDFSQLDGTVNDILSMGAKPFFSLSYMPAKYTTGGTIIEPPSDWKHWSELIQKTIERYSGRDQMNLQDVYYEVWNEPDLPQFGGWKLTGDKNYNNLYLYADKGAEAAENTNKFFLGGPAVGSYYPEWVDNFVSYVNANNLRLDFYSWHRYHQSPDKFREDAENIRKILRNYPKFGDTPLVLSEWGIDSENNLLSGTDKAAAQTLSTIFKIYDLVSMPFAFEIKDGVPPDGGKWGLMTNEKDSSPLYLKPRFKAFAATNYMMGLKLKTSGWGSKVQALASQSIDGTIYVLLTNYDPGDVNFENVPVTLTGLDSGLYKFDRLNITTGVKESLELSSTDGKIQKEIVMLPNSISLLEYRKTGNLAEYITGPSGMSKDKAFTLANGRDLILSPFAYDVARNNNFKFDIKILEDSAPGMVSGILKMNLENVDGAKYSLSLIKTTSRNIDFLLLILDDSKTETRLATPVSNWIKDNWHTVNISFIDNSISLKTETQENTKEVLTLNGESRITGVKFYPGNFGLDNIAFSKDGITQFTKDFN